jgi:hypothetical protein
MGMGSRQGPIYAASTIPRPLFDLGEKVLPGR